MTDSSDRDRLQAILDSLPLFIGLVDEDGRILMVNRVPPAAMGAQPADLLGKLATELEPWNHLPETQAAWEAHLPRAARGETVRFDAKLKLPGGFRILDMIMSPVPASEGASEVVAAGSDVTERRQIEEDLRRSEEGLARAQRMARMGNWEQELPHGPTRRSAEMCRLFSLSESEKSLEPEAVLERVHPDDRDRVAGLLKSAKERHEPYAVEYRLRRPDGSLRYVREHAEVVPANGHATERLVVTVQDVSEFAEAQQRLERSLAEKEVLLQEIHHRVKNNLQVVSSLLALQAMDIDDETISQPLVESQRRVQAMAHIHELMYQSEDLTRIDFGEYVHRLRSAVHLDGRGVVELETEVSTPPLAIDVAVPCGLIASELVTNAYRHAFPDGREGTIRVELATDADDWVLAVEDDGVGVSPELLDGKAQGGLGLRLVRALARQLHGELRIIQTGRSTTFEVRFQPPAG